MADGGQVQRQLAEVRDDDEDTCAFGDPGCDGGEGDDLPCFDCYLSARLDHYPEDAVAVPDTSGDDGGAVAGAGE